MTYTLPDLDLEGRPMSESRSCNCSLLFARLKTFLVLRFLLALDYFLMLESRSTTEEEIKRNRREIEAMKGEVTEEDDLVDANEAQDVRKDRFKDCEDDGGDGDGDDGDFLAPSNDGNPCLPGFSVTPAEQKRNPKRLWICKRSTTMTSQQDRRRERDYHNVLSKRLKLIKEQYEKEEIYCRAKGAHQYAA